MGDLGWPSTPDGLDTAWWTTALASRGAIDGGTTVATAEATSIAVGVGILSLLWRVALTYDGGSGPPTVILKLPHTAPGALETVHAFRFYGREINFYREAADRTPLGTAAALTAEYDPDSQAFVLVMEDLGDRRQHDQLAGCPLDDALVAVRALAGHHAACWEDPALHAADWTVPTNAPPNPQALPPTLRQSWPVIEAEFADLLPGPMLAAARSMPDRCVDLLDRLSVGPTTLLHGDYRLDNLFFGDTTAGEEALVAVDWQICGLGRGPYDLAYFMSQSLTPAARREADETVVRAYHEALVAGGVADYGYDECWEDYRLGILFCVVYPLNAGAVDMANDRAVALFRAMLERSVAAITDLDALELLA